MATPLAVVVGLTVPQSGAQDTPPCVRVQLTPLLVASLVTAAVNCCVSLSATLDDVGDADTEIARTGTGKALAESLVFVIEVATIAKKPLK